MALSSYILSSDQRVAAQERDEGQCVTAATLRFRGTRPIVRALGDDKKVLAKGPIETGLRVTDLLQRLGHAVGANGVEIGGGRSGMLRIVERPN